MASNSQITESKSPITIATECFSNCHKDIIPSKSKRTISNNYQWCYHRTCYGNVEIPSDSDLTVKWTIDIVKQKNINSNICIGIDSSQDTNTSFYKNKTQPNYGYECTGKLFESSEVKNSTKKYGMYDTVTMILHTTSGLLEFYTSHQDKTTQTDHKDTGDDENKLPQEPVDDDKKEPIDDNKQESVDNNKQESVVADSKPVHSFKIKTGSDLKYRLAVSLKDATVSIVDFSYCQSKKTGYIEEKEACVDIESVERLLSNQMKIFQQNYNETTLQNICNDNPEDLLFKESKLNRNMKTYENNIQSLTKSLNEFNEYIENTKLMIKKLSTPNEFDYKNWSVNTIIVWIGNIDDGRYVKYLEKLKNGFIKSEILNGELLPDLDVATLSVAPFEINSFPDKKDLIAKFKTLKTMKTNVDVEGTKATSYI